MDGIFHAHPAEYDCYVTVLCFNHVPGREEENEYFQLICGIMHCCIHRKGKRTGVEAFAKLRNIYHNKLV